MIKNKRYVFRNGKLVEEAEAPPAEHHYVQGDIPAYQSPASLKVIDGRAQRREDLKRTGCREVDPSERKPEYQPQRVWKDIPVGEG